MVSKCPHPGWQGSSSGNSHPSDPHSLLPLSVRLGEGKGRQRYKEGRGKAERKGERQRRGGERQRPNNSNREGRGEHAFNVHVKSIVGSKIYLETLKKKFQIDFGAVL